MTVAVPPTETDQTLDVVAFLGDDEGSELPAIGMAVVDTTGAAMHS